MRQADHSSRGPPTVCGVPDCDLKTSTTSRPRPARGCRAIKKEAQLKNIYISHPVWTFFHLIHSVFQLHIFHQLIIKFNSHEAANLIVLTSNEPNILLPIKRSYSTDQRWFQNTRVKRHWNVEWRDHITYISDCVCLTKHHLSMWKTTYTYTQIIHQ